MLLHSPNCFPKKPLHYRYLHFSNNIFSLIFHKFFNSTTKYLYLRPLDSYELNPRSTHVYSHIPNTHSRRTALQLGLAASACTSFISTFRREHSFLYYFPSANFGWLIHFSSRLNRLWAQLAMNWSRGVANLQRWVTTQHVTAHRTRRRFFAHPTTPFYWFPNVLHILLLRWKFAALLLLLLCGWVNTEPALKCHRCTWP